LETKILEGYHTMKSVCVYCGSSDKTKSVYLEAARQLGAIIARRGLQLWYGAGSTGLMGAVADGALQAGGEVVGVIPKFFNTPRLAHGGLSRLEVVDTMHQRKERLALQADGFIALPGGYGTFEEFFEILTWAQVGLHQKPVGLLNVAGYFEPLLAMVEHARLEGFIYAEHRTLFMHASDSDQLLDAMELYRPPQGLERWVTREE
jgi:uncharacterized protein (TIGR00730 family)